MCAEANREEQALAERVVKRMLAKDAFSRWLGIEVLEIAPRRSTLRMAVRSEMVNGFGVSHGGSDGQKSARRRRRHLSGNRVQNRTRP